MPESADYLTLDVYDQPPGGTRRWSRGVNAALQQGIPGLRSVTVNHSNHLSLAGPEDSHPARPRSHRCVGIHPNRRWRHSADRLPGR